jgi:cellulose synthase/poly-beta-1,6-N-acetylglucosamine synthase-like glycosyltransferase
MPVAISYPLYFAVTLAAALVFVIALILLAEILASFLRVRPSRHAASGPLRMAILMPAHNEALVIEETLSRLKPQLRPGDRLIVIADNCDDQTGRIAEKAGAEVIYRDEPALRGKGYALDFGIRHLAAAPPEAVIILDADCYAEPGALHKIAALAVAEQRPVQARYDLEPPPGKTSDYLATASLAWSVKNYVRPLGLRNLGLPCQLMGTGMAFPWEVISKAKLQTANIVEDIALGLELAEAGKAPLFMPEARVVSRFPESTEGQHTQRARWERGHLSVIARQVPPLLLQALKSGNLNLFVLASDIAVPPLTFLLFATVAAAVVSGAVALFGGWFTPLVLSLLAAGFLASAIALAAYRLGQSNYFLNIFRRMPAYAVSKLTLYAAAFSGKPIGWIRSRRD